MKRTSLFLTDRQREQLARESKLTSIPQAAMIRKAIDEYLERRREQAKTRS